MRPYIFAPRAQHDLQSQIDHLLQQGAFTPAEDLASRVESFVARFLAVHPKTGVFLAHRNLWESWIPRTNLVLWYRFSDTTLEIARVWHTSQDRQSR